MEIRIDEELRKIIPPLSPDERAGLEADIIAADAVREPILTWGGVIVDGHNRFDIATKHTIPFTTREMEFEDLRAVRIWMRKNQLHRRNLPTHIKLDLLADNRRELAEIGREKYKDTVGRPKESLSNWTANTPKHDTRKEIAKQAGCSVGTVARADYTRKHAPEVWDKVKTGEVTIGGAYKEARAPHVSQNSGNNEWYTPAEYIEAARTVMGGIDCDPASSEIANRIVKAETFYTIDDDGLTKEWSGRVWMNPPYAQPLCSQFCEEVTTKYINGEIDEAIVLINNATETGFFQLMAVEAAAVCFPRGRVKFLNPQGKPGAPLQGQAVIYLGEKSTKFCESFKDFGTVGVVYK